MKINYQNLEKKINFKFKNINLLIQSLTHKSFDTNRNNEKIEFLGDRVLGLVIAKKLLEIYPDKKEGSIFTFWKWHKSIRFYRTFDRIN